MSLSHAGLMSAKLCSHPPVAQPVDFDQGGRMYSPLTQEQAELADTVRRFAEKELADGALKRAHAREYPWDAAEKLAGMGLLGIAMKEEDGGAGGTLMDAVVAIQEIAKVCPKSADIVQAGNFGPIRTFVEYEIGRASCRERVCQYV